MTTFCCSNVGLSVRMWTMVMTQLKLALGSWRTEKVAKRFVLVAAVLACSALGSRGHCADSSGITVAKFQVANDTESPSKSRALSFGQIFRPGSVFAKTALVARVGGQPAPVQLDAKAFNADGSIRHAIVTVEVPELGRLSKVDGELLKAAQPATTTATGGEFPSIPQLSVAIRFNTTNELGAPLIVRLTDAVAGNEKPWIDGPIAREIRRYVKVTDQLEIAFDVFTPRKGPARVDVVVHNDWAGMGGANPLVYDAEIRLNDVVVYSAKAVKHFRYQTWHKVIWTDGATPPRIIADLDLMIDAGAIPAYATSVRPAQESIAELGAKLDQSGDQPLGPALVEMRMPNTGGRPDIGPLPTWAVYYLLAPSGATERVLLANGDAAGSIPWHLRERATRLPLTIDAYPDLWLDARGGPYPNVLPEPFNPEPAGWETDDAHQPSLVYLPYVLTGSQYYRDELAQQASYDLLFFSPYDRGGAKGLMGGSQVRGLAWMLRNIGNAAFILPKSDPLQRYFETKLEGNLRQLVNDYVEKRTMKAAGELEGWVPGAYNPDGATAPWQQDYLAMVLAWLDAMGYPDAGRLLTWMSHFLAGRFTSGDRGYDPIYGTAYILYVYDAETNRLFDRWSEAFKRSFDPSKDVREFKTPDWAGGYEALARGALAGALTVTRSPTVAEAYTNVVLQTPRMVNDYPETPTFAIMPAFADGTRLSLSNIKIGTAGAEKLQGSADSDLLIGGDEDDSITGGGGTDLLFGGAGNDVIEGGAGDDMLFGGTGNDTLDPGTGADSLMGGAGADRFQFKTANLSEVTIQDFDPKSDRLILARGLIEGGASKLAEKIASARWQDDHLTIAFGPSARIRFRGIKDAQLIASAIEVVN